MVIVVSMAMVRVLATGRLGCSISERQTFPFVGSLNCCFSWFWFVARRSASITALRGVFLRVSAPVAWPESLSPLQRQTGVLHLFIVLV